MTPNYQMIPISTSSTPSSLLSMCLRFYGCNQEADTQHKLSSRLKLKSIFLRTYQWLTKVVIYHMFVFVY